MSLQIRKYVSEYVGSNATEDTRKAQSIRVSELDEAH